MKFPMLIFLLCIRFMNAQPYSKAENTVISQALKLDSLMEKNEPEILKLLSEKVSFGHSNGWIQNYKDFKKDFSSGKVRYTDVRQTEISEIKSYCRSISLRRKIVVKGLYKNQNFSMHLSLLEIWIREKSAWHLWSRQSVELK